MQYFGDCLHDGGRCTALFQQIIHADDGIEGRPYFMADSGHKFAFGLAGFVRPLDGFGFTQIQRQPLIEVIYFVKDEKKVGGAYMTKKGRLKKIDSYQKHIIFTDGTRIAFADLRQLDSDLLPFSADLDFLE